MIFKIKPTPSKILCAHKKAHNMKANKLIHVVFARENVALNFFLGP